MTQLEDRDRSLDTSRKSFRNHLLRRTAPAIIVSLLLLCTIIWATVYLAFKITEKRLLVSEINEVTSMVGYSGTDLEPDRYVWHEPHHLSISIGRDPLFVQVFDSSGALLRQSENAVELERNSAFPDTLFVRLAGTSRKSIQPASFEVSGQAFHVAVGRIEAHSGHLLGFVQVMKYAPDIQTYLTYWAYLLIGVFSFFSILIIGTIAWSANRVLRPLKAITQYAEQVSIDDLGVPLVIPESADFESMVLATALNDLTTRLKTMIDGVRQFTADAAHEMVTPLTILRGHIDVALRRPRTDASYEQTLRFLESRMDQMIRMVRGLILLARMDESNHVAIEPVDISVIANTVYQELEGVASSKGLDFSVSVSERTVADAQTDLIKEAILNLVENAIKYTETGWIRLSVDRTDDTVLIRVEDSGPGLEAEEQKLIWRRFYRTAKASLQRVEGSGLGLALTQKIITRLSGHVDVVSTLGVGSRFIISLPATGFSEAIENEE